MLIQRVIVVGLKPWFSLVVAWRSLSGPGHVGLPVWQLTTWWFSSSE